MVGPAMAVPLSAADPPDVHHASVADTGDWGRTQQQEVGLLRSAGGGVGRQPETAEIAAIAESLERYAASVVELDTAVGSSLSSDQVVPLDDWTLHHPDQRSSPAFPDPEAYPGDPTYTPAYSLVDNTEHWVPAGLMALRRDFGSLATSSGLAAHFSPSLALLRAVQELVERDAYVVTWLHGIAGRRHAVPQLEMEVAPLGGTVVAYDITPAYSPHPVACVAGSLPLRGRARNSLGVACRANWGDAVEKAYLEFVQGTMFVGHQLARVPELETLQPETCTGFDEHAVYWSVHGDQWWGLPLHAEAAIIGHPTAPTDQEPTDQEPVQQLEKLAQALSNAGVRVYYRRLPTAGLDQLGLHVVRALSPDLVPLHHDHNWPFLGGTAPDLSIRFPDRATYTPFPNPNPHALG